MDFIQLLERRYLQFASTSARNNARGRWLYLAIIHMDEAMTRSSYEMLFVRLFLSLAF